LSCDYDEDAHSNYRGQKCKIRITTPETESCRLVFDDPANSTILTFSTLYGSMPHFPDISQPARKFPNIEYLDIGFSEIKHISRAKLAPMKGITWISLFGNKIQQLDFDTFHDLTKVVKILLANNQLSSLPRDIFKYNRKLQEVWLGGNQLEFLRENLFINNPELNTIYAGENKLKQIDIDFTVLPNFKIIDLRNNVCMNEWCDSNGYCGTGSVEEMQRKIRRNC
jgi:Leucine-rich repeat (LRR) protein